MINVDIKPDSRREDEKWIPDGMVRFPSGPSLTEHREFFQEPKFDTKEEADQYFMQVCRKKYRVEG